MSHTPQDNTATAPTPRQDVLLVSEHVDALVQRVRDAAVAGGARTECVPDVYAAMARLAQSVAGAAISRVVVDTRGLDAVEERFLPLAAQLYRQVEVIDLRTALESLRDAPRVRAAETVQQIDDPVAWHWSGAAPTDVDRHENAADGHDLDPSVTSDAEAASGVAAGVDRAAGSGPASTELPRIVARIGPSGIDSAVDHAVPAAAAQSGELSLHDAVRRRMRSAAVESGATLAAVHRLPPGEQPPPAADTIQSGDEAGGEALLSREELDALLGRLEADLKEMDA